MFEKILDKIKNNSSIVIFGHINPDGDCFGASIALREIIKTAFPEKQVFATGSGLYNFKDIISSTDVVSEETISKSLAILVDGNSLYRSEDTRIFKAKEFAKIDHHIDLKDFNSGPEVIVENASSTCEVIFDFAKECNFTINKVAANALYLGIITDTLRFQYCEDYLKIYDICHSLVALGAEPKEINKGLNANKDEEYLDFVKYVYINYKKTEHGVIYLTVPYQEAKKYNMDSITIARYVRLISKVSHYPIAAFFVERENGTLVAEFRSSDLNIQPIAAKYGGGGHEHAAGIAVSSHSISKSADILEDLDRLITGE